MKPYKEEKNNNIIRRSFSKDVNENELSWHRDKKDRVVIVFENNDWMIQFDNELPKKLNVNEEIFIPKNTFHRVIKGSGDLMVEVIETDFEDGEYTIFEIIQEGKKKKKKTKRDACYYKVKSRYSVWPSAYSSGALVKCRKVGAANWGNKTNENKEEFQNRALEKINKIGGFNNLPDVDKLALLGGTNDDKLKNLNLIKIFKENGGTFGLLEIKVKVKNVNEQPINHKFSKEFAGEEGYLFPYINYSDDNEPYVTVRFDKFVSNLDNFGGGNYEERPIMLDNIYPIDYDEIKSDFVKYQNKIDFKRNEFKKSFDDLENLEEKWSEKYKKSIDCSNPKGFSQKAHCQGRKKIKESIDTIKLRQNEINGILKGYIEAALWTEEERLNDDLDNDIELQKINDIIGKLNNKSFLSFTKDDITDNSLIKAYTDIKKFLASAGDSVIEAITYNGLEQLGHDIWLTRNRHGAGFFDHSYDDDVEKQLTSSAQSLGEVDLYINDDYQLSFGNEHLLENESISNKKNISFEHEHLNTHHGQSDYELGVYEDGEVIGYVDYVIFNNELTVSDILVRPNRRREGFGSMLIKKMKQLHPEAEYKPSLKTDLGSKFIHKDVKIDEVKKFIKKIMEENMNIINEISSEEAYNKFYKNLFNKDDEKSDKEKFNKIIDLDPTYNKDKNKLGEYTRWLFRKDNLELLKKAKDEDLYKIKNDLDFFNTSKIKNLLPTDKKDINKFNIKTLLDFIFDLESKSDISNLKSKTDTEKEIKEDVDKYNLTNWTIIVPKTEEASCYYGKGTKWCTAATGYNNMFDSYNSRGSLYILINKQDPSEKYQFHFEDAQFMDAKDNPIFLGEFMSENDDVYKFFNEIYDNDLDFNICESSLEDGDTESFENFYSKKFTDEQKERLVRVAFERDGYSDGYYKVSMVLNYIDYPDMAKDFRGDFLYGLEASIQNRYDDENYDAKMFIYHIGGFNEDNIDDIMNQVNIKDLDEIEKIIQIANHFEAFKLLEIYFVENDIDFNLDMLETINNLKDKFEYNSESYRKDVLSSKLVKFEMEEFNFKTGYVKGYLTPKNDKGKLIKDKRSNVNIYYKNIIKYLTMPRLFTEGKKTINKTKEIDREKLSREMIKKAHDSITRRKGKEYAPDVHELQAWIDDYIKTNNIKLDESKKTNFSKEKSQGLHGWFSRKGGEGSQGWVDCNTCRKNKETGRLKCKPCGREEGEERAKYPACRPYPSACKTKGKGKSWGKKSIKENSENRLIDEKLVLSNYKDYAEIVAQSYIDAPDFDESMIPSYNALMESTKKLFKQLQSKLKVEFVDYNPYESRDQMNDEVKKTGVLKILSLYNDHPLFSKEENLMFRAVHDYFTHIISNQNFDLRGELKAYNTHAKLVPPDALPALFTEVAGQACYAIVNGSFPKQKICKLNGFDYKNIGKIDDINIVNKQLQLNEIKNMVNFKQKLEEIMSNKDENSNNYMFWQNLKTIYHAVSEMKGMDFETVDNMLSDGHGWALDHIATSKDDVEEVYHFLTNKMDVHGVDKHYIQRQLNETFGDDDDDEDERPKQTQDNTPKNKKSKKHNIEKPLNIKRENKPFLPMADIE